MFNFFNRKSKPETICFHTDIHCHLVPGIDDGQKEPAPAAELVERQREWGFSRVFTTPHVTQDTFENTPETINPAFLRLKDAVEKRGVDVELYHSAEYRIDNFFQRQLKAGNVNPYPGNYILVENSFVQEAWNFDQLMFDLRLQGFKPILAHPERYAYYFNNSDRYRQIKESGILFQVNLLSLAGFYNREVKKIAESLVEKGWVDFIGTDMHHTRHADAIESYLSSREYRRLVSKLDGRLLNDSAF